MALRSLSKCYACDATLPSSGIVCPSCHKMQPTPDTFAPFEVFGLSDNLKVDVERLRETFYALSKQTHPDRFTQADTVDALNANRWSQLINRSHATLKDRAKRAEYLLEKHGVKSTAASVPLDLADQYFELQDGSAGKTELENFRSEIATRLNDHEKQWEEIENAWGQADEQVLLQKTAKHLSMGRFLNSLLHDIDGKLAK